MIRRPRRSPLFPYTPLSRSIVHSTAGRMTVTGPPVKLSATPARVSTAAPLLGEHTRQALAELLDLGSAELEDRKSTRLNSSHSQISYAVFCLKKKKHN